MKRAQYVEIHEMRQEKAVLRGVSASQREQQLPVGEACQHPKSRGEVLGEILGGN